MVTHYLPELFHSITVCVCVFLQVTTLYLVQVSGLLSVWLLQFCNSMILGSLVLSFIVAALFIRHFQVSPFVCLCVLCAVWHRESECLTSVSCVYEHRWQIKLHYKWMKEAYAAVSFCKTWFQLVCWCAFFLSVLNVIWLNQILSQQQLQKH